MIFMCMNMCTLINCLLCIKCGAKQSGDFGKPFKFDGLVGFKWVNSSMISQLTITKKAKTTFAYCLDNINGGGIQIREVL